MTQTPAINEPPLPEYGPAECRRNGAIRERRSRKQRQETFEAQMVTKGAERFRKRLEKAEKTDSPESIPTYHDAMGDVLKKLVEPYEDFLDKQVQRLSTGGTGGTKGKQCKIVMAAACIDVYRTLFIVVRTILGFRNLRQVDEKDLEEEIEDEADDEAEAGDEDTETAPTYVAIALAVAQALIKERGIDIGRAQWVLDNSEKVEGKKQDLPLKEQQPIPMTEVIKSHMESNLTGAGSNLSRNQKQRIEKLRMDEIWLNDLAISAEKGEADEVFKDAIARDGFLIQVGSLLLEPLEQLGEDSGFKITREGGGRESYKVEMTSDLRYALEQGIEKEEELATPWLQPMVSPPRPWRWNGKRYVGGYFTFRRPLISARSWDPHTLALEGDPVGPVMRRAIHLIQRTEWAINEPVASYLRQAVKQGITLEQDNMPRRKQAGRKRIVKRFLAACRGYQDGASFWFPHYIDHRGRIYTMTSNINPQSTDPLRASLRFAQGLPLGEHGERYLKLEMVNAYGKERGTYGTRLKWFGDRRNKIELFAEDPFKDLGFWRAAKKPWRFLAAALEWRELCKTGSENFISHLPIHQDGRCNGLQHIAALVRNPELALATNVRGSEDGKPQDIYIKIVQLLHKDIQEKAASSASVNEWLPHLELIDRDLVKTPVMIFAYGAGKKSLADHILRKLREHPDVSIGGSAVEYLVCRIMETKESGMFQASQLRRGLQAVAGRLAEHHIPLEWATPAGMRILVANHKTRAHKVRLGRGSTQKVLSLKQWTKENELSPKRQKQAILPSLIHSLDAAHLALTTNACHGRGIQSFSVVHDSFATHACHAKTMGAVLRETFAGMYTKTVLAGFYQGWRNANIDISPCPEMGTLNVGDVCESEYFFD